MHPDLGRKGEGPLTSRKPSSLLVRQKNYSGEIRKLEISLKIGLVVGIPGKWMIMLQLRKFRPGLKYLRYLGKGGHCALLQKKRRRMNLAKVKKREKELIQDSNRKPQHDSRNAYDADITVTPGPALSVQRQKRKGTCTKSPPTLCTFFSPSKNITESSHSHASSPSLFQNQKKCPSKKFH